MILEFHMEDLSEIQVLRSADLGTTKIAIRDCYATTLVIVIPDGDILDELAHHLLMASIDAELHD